MDSDSPRSSVYTDFQKANTNKSSARLRAKSIADVSVRYACAVWKSVGHQSTARTVFAPNARIKQLYSDDVRRYQRWPRYCAGLIFSIPKYGNACLRTGVGPPTGLTPRRYIYTRFNVLCSETVSFLIHRLSLDSRLDIYASSSYIVARKTTFHPPHPRQSVMRIFCCATKYMEKPCVWSFGGRTKYRVGLLVC